MGDQSNRFRLLKYYYKLYYTLTTSSMWIKSTYKPDCPMDKTHLTPIIFSVRKLAKKLTMIADGLEDLLND